MRGSKEEEDVTTKEERRHDEDDVEENPYLVLWKSWDATERKGER